MASTMYGYARVSSREQNLDRQLDALRAFGVEDGAVYADKASGKDFERPAWHRLMGELRPGDVLAVKSIDRLGRDYAEILDVWRDVTKTRGVFVVVLDMPVLDTREERDGITGVLIADIVLQLLSYVAQIERENIRQRQAEGISGRQSPRGELRASEEEAPCELPGDAGGLLGWTQNAERGRRALQHTNIAQKAWVGAIGSDIVTEGA